MSSGPLPVLARRRFLALGGAGAAGLIIAGCGEEEQAQPPSPVQQPMQGADVTLDFAQTTDVLNYALALESLEAAFYAMAVKELYSGASDEERMILEDIGAHERVHREFLTQVLGDDAVQGLEVDFSQVDFANRQSVLGTAKTFENLGVGAYNGAAKFLAANAQEDLALTALMAAGDIVSVEARHASVIAAQLEPGQDGEFAPNAFDKALPPEQVLEAAQPFIRQRLAATNTNVQGG